jgi:hypothetical protein
MKRRPDPHDAAASCGGRGVSVEGVWGELDGWDSAIAPETCLTGWDRKKCVLSVKL